MHIDELITELKQFSEDCPMSFGEVKAKCDEHILAIERALSFYEMKPLIAIAGLKTDKTPVVRITEAHNPPFTPKAGSAMTSQGTTTYKDGVATFTPASKQVEELKKHLEGIEGLMSYFKVSKDK
jgi:hypothetical protein